MTFTAPASAFEHLALFYDGDDAYVKGVASFLQAGSDGAALVAVPVGTSTSCGAGPAASPGRCAERTHPHLVDGEQRLASSHYRDPLEFTDPANWPLDPAPQAAAPPVPFGGLVEPRRRVRAQAADAGLEPDRLAALLLAVNEICTNTLQHGPGHGTLRLWATDNGVVCEVHDAGAIADPLAGRHPSRAAADRGRGMVLAHHLCDLVEVRSSPAAGTTVRLHVHR